MLSRHLAALLEILKHPVALLAGTCALMLLVIIATRAPGSEQQPPTDAELIAALTSGHEAASAGLEAVVATRRSQSGKPSGPRGMRQARVSDMVNLEVVGGHRLYDLYQNLFLAFAVAKQSGLCLAPLHTGQTPGTLYAPRFNDHNFTAVPLEAFADFASDQAPCRAPALPPDAPRFQMRAFNTSCSAGDSHPADGATAAQAHRIRAQPRARWCPQRVDGRLVSIDVCVSVCFADGNSYRPAGEAIREAAELVAARSSTSGRHRSRASLVLQLGRGHEKSIARVTHYGQLHRGSVQVRLSQPMAALGAEYVRVYLGCGATHGRTVGASLRIIYHGGKRHTPTLFKEGCKSSFKALGRWVAQRAPPALADGDCPRRGYLATDWAAMADGWKSSSHQSAIQQCWEEANVEEAATTSEPSRRATKHIFWTWPPDPRQLLALAARAAPALLRQHGHGGKGPRAVDVNSFQDFFELAVLAQVDECYVASHFGSLASRARSQFNRSACQGH